MKSEKRHTPERNERAKRYRVYRRSEQEGTIERVMLDGKEWFVGFASAQMRMIKGKNK